jgi:hypothetical protein
MANALGPELPVEIVATLRRCFPETAVHALAQQSPGTNVADADQTDVRKPSAFLARQ